jgi:A/G-specific adenine glycosylase
LPGTARLRRSADSRKGGGYGRPLAYARFLERFPTVETLSAAPLAEAIRAWGDLGRYRRVANLHRTARIVVEEHDGRIPADPDVLVKLPGIGPYTAGAVACFAFEGDVRKLVPRSSL